jgi:sugar lactone lactonase YvrE
MAKESRLGAIALAVAGAVCAAAVSAATPAEIAIPGTGVFPESITSSKDGTLYIGSVGKSLVYRAAPGKAAAEEWIKPGTGGIKQVFGVLADDASGTLWLCSNQLGGPPGSPPTGTNALHAFDLASGQPKGSWPFPAGGMCNDIAIGADGSAYATDTMGMQVLRLPKNGKALEVWSAKGAYGAPGGVLDGIAVVDGRVIVNALVPGKFFATAVKPDGSAGAVTELKLSKPVTRPDGMRAWGKGGLLTTEGTGRIDHLMISGDSAMVHTVKEGLDGVVSVTVVGNSAYALEGQLAIMMGPPNAPKPAEKPYRAVGFDLPAQHAH